MNNLSSYSMPDSFPDATKTGTQSSIRQLIRDELSLLIRERESFASLAVLPKKLRPGNLLLADGYSFDPGSGPGFYRFDPQAQELIAMTSPSPQYLKEFIDTGFSYESLVSGGGTDDEAGSLHGLGWRLFTLPSAGALASRGSSTKALYLDSGASEYHVSFETTLFVSDLAATDPDYELFAGFYTDPTDYASNNFGAYFLYNKDEANLQGQVKSAFGTTTVDLGVPPGATYSDRLNLRLTLQKLQSTLAAKFYINGQLVQTIGDVPEDYWLYLGLATLYISGAFSPTISYNSTKVSVNIPAGV